MKVIWFAVACAFAMAPAFAGRYGYHFGGNRLISGNPSVGLHVVRPAGMGQRQLYLAPRPVIRQTNPYTGQKVVRKPARAN